MFHIFVQRLVLALGLLAAFVLMVDASNKPTVCVGEESFPRNYTLRVGEPFSFSVCFNVEVWCLYEKAEVQLDYKPPDKNSINYDEELGGAFIVNSPTRRKTQAKVNVSMSKVTEEDFKNDWILYVGVFGNETWVGDRGGHFHFSLQKETPTLFTEPPNPPTDSPTSIAETSKGTRTKTKTSTTSTTTTTTHPATSLSESTPIQPEGSTSKPTDNTSRLDNASSGGTPSKPPQTGSEATKTSLKSVETGTTSGADNFGSRHHQTTSQIDKADKTGQTPVETSADSYTTTSLPISSAHPKYSSALAGSTFKSTSLIIPLSSVLAVLIIVVIIVIIVAFRRNKRSQSEILTEADSLRAASEYMYAMVDRTLEQNKAKKSKEVVGEHPYATVNKVKSNENQETDVDMNPPRHATINRPNKPQPKCTGDGAEQPYATINKVKNVAIKSQSTKEDPPTTANTNKNSEIQANPKEALKSFNLKRPLQVDPTCLKRPLQADPTYVTMGRPKKKVGTEHTNHLSRVSTLGKSWKPSAVYTDQLTTTNGPPTPTPQPHTSTLGKSCKAHPYQLTATTEPLTPTPQTHQSTLSKSRKPQTDQLTSANQPTSPIPQPCTPTLGKSIDPQTDHLPSINLPPVSTLGRSRKPHTDRLTTGNQPPTSSMPGPSRPTQGDQTGRFLNDDGLVYVTVEVNNVTPDPLAELFCDWDKFEPVEYMNVDHEATARAREQNGAAE